MIQPIEVTALSAQAQKLVHPTAPQKIQEVTARGVAPGLRPGEIVSVLVLLTSSDRPSVKELAEKTLGALPEPILNGALAVPLPELVLDVLARLYADRVDVVEKLLGAAIHPDSVEHLARVGSEAVTENIATNEERLLANPRIIEHLYMNKRTRMSTADRLIELAVRNKVELGGIPAWREASLAIQNELVLVEPQPEPTPDDVEFQKTQALAEELTSPVVEDTHEEVAEGVEELKKKFLPLYKRIADMTISQRIRAGMLGTREERALLVRDHNRLVASAAVRSPMVQEDEVILFTRNRNLSDEVLRIIGTSPEWLRSYSVKKNLVENPKTPITISTRLVQHLRESDLRKLTKSKNITGPVKDAARRHLDRRKG